ncbi:MAG: hypothetical protein IPI03_09145 [Rubrivivax sp.]|nr:hypothetical protein [Rubrivivax sp.]MBK8528219.1 hypothetical protein [Rubrivivax sp.]
MQHNRRRNLVIAFALAGLAVQASAIGFGAVAASTTLGQTLDHLVSLRLDPGEFVSAECVTAEVTVGEQRLAPGVVRTRLEGEGSQLRLRVTTLTAIDEPVVNLAVSVGCPPRLSRRFVLFADPAPTNLPSLPLMAARDADSAAVPDARAAAPAPAAEPRAAAAASAPALRPMARVNPPPRVRHRPAAARRPAPPRESTTSAAAAPRARLRLDAAEPMPSPAMATADVIEAAASAAATLAAAQASAQATSAAAARIAALEQSIEKLRADAAADRQALQILRQRAADGDTAARWMPWLLGLLALMTLAIVWLGLKLRRLQALRDPTWWVAGGAAAAAAASAAAAPAEARASEAPEAASDAEPASTGPSTAGYSSTRPGTLGPVFSAELPLADPVTESPLTVTERTQALPLGWRDESEAQRDVSIEELIDLEQQAEFFIVLGQEDAAIDLLVEHLRSTGGGSPMPYLKLLEIYRRRGDHEAYERTRARFNHRFNAYAPDWEADAQDGRQLEDYPSIVARLQLAWPSPIDAMAELESLLFRKTRGDLFDMPAYRDVLFLYSLARDLLGREPMDRADVDVLLPINEGADFTQPMSLDDSPSERHALLATLEGQPTVPIDLDVTQPGMPESLFGEATRPGVGSRRRR